MRRFLLLSNFLVLFSDPVLALESRTLTVVWHDSSRLFPVVGVENLRVEVEELFHRHRLPVRFHAAEENENLRRIPEPRVNAILIPDQGGRFHLPPNAMAAVLSERGKKHTIFLFYSGVKRTLGHRDEVTPRHLAELSRALARILAHEVVHVLAPERGHAESGLMTGVLERDNLLGELLELDRRSVQIARGKLESLAGVEPAASAELRPARPKPGGRRPVAPVTMFQISKKGMNPFD